MTDGNGAVIGKRELGLYKVGLLVANFPKIQGAAME
jgi:hypothetical protein